MLDTHNTLKNIEPIALSITAYTVFVAAGLIAGIVYYFAETRRRHINSDGAVAIVFSGLIFGFIGSKIPLMFEGHDIAVTLAGKSIVGGILGGMLGVIAIKKALKIKLRLGNVIAPSLALGMAVGRVGCFFAGCCFGIPANWGCDFGDGTLRLPTQLFEVAFHSAAFILLRIYKDKVKTQGILFKIYVFIYFIFRFIVEFIRENPIVLYGLTVYQIICVIGILYMGIMIYRSVRIEQIKRKAGN